MTGSKLSRWTPGHIAMLVWMASSAVMIGVFWSSIAQLTTIDPDDALRLVQVRDLLAGQGWWDVIQHRINPAGGGGLMHWSRIVDLPIAAGIGALQAVLGRILAEQIVLATWPLVMLGLLFLLAARCFTAVSGRTVAMIAVALIATDYLILFQFAPLRIDHHGWQILLTLAMLHQLIRPADLFSGLLAGLSAATLIAISLEGLPAIVLIAAIMAAEWLWTGTAASRLRLTLFLASLTAAAALLQVMTRGPDALVQTWCDALSLPYLAAFATAAIAVASLAPLADRVAATQRQSRAIRTAALGIAGLLSAATLLLTEPACAAGPFGTLDPVVVDYWYVNVHEGRPIWIETGPMFAFALMPMLVGLVGTALAWRAAGDSEAQRRWLIMLAALAGTVALALLVLRAASVAHLFALPGTAWLLIAGWQRARRVQSVAARIVASLAATLLIPPFAGSVLAIFLIERADIAAANGSGGPTKPAVVCVDSASSGALNRLSPATIMAPLDIGPHLLQRTHHSVTATGHHRNNAVMAQTIAAYVGDPGRALSRAQSMAASLIVICPQANEIGNFRQARGDGLADLLMTGRAPAWLEPIAMPEGAALRAWRIRPEPTMLPAPSR